MGYSSCLCRIGESRSPPSALLNLFFKLSLSWPSVAKSDVYVALDTPALCLPVARALLASRCELRTPGDLSPSPLLNSCFKNSLMRGLLVQLKLFIKTY